MKIVVLYEELLLLVSLISHQLNAYKDIYPVISIANPVCLTD